MSGELNSVSSVPDNNLLNGTKDLLDRHPVSQLQALADEWECDILSEDFAKKMDEQDTLKHLRNEFVIPKVKQLPFSEYDHA